MAGRWKIMTLFTSLPLVIFLLLSLVLGACSKSSGPAGNSPPGSSSSTNPAIEPPIAAVPGGGFAIASPTPAAATPTPIGTATPGPSPSRVPASTPTPTPTVTATPSPGITYQGISN